MLAEPYVLGDAPPRLSSFSFDTKLLPCTTFHFSTPRKGSVGPVSLKRHRSVADVDGEGSSVVQKKKRRLRLELVTSRLSQPYATPTTYIISRESIKGTKRLKPSFGGRSLLRKAAIINWMRRRKAQSYCQSLSAPQASLADDPSSYDAEDIEMIDGDNGGRRRFRPLDHNASHAPHTPSPLGLSNYDAIDSEGDPYDDESWDEPSDGFVNSDFSKRDPVDAVFTELEGYPSLYLDVASPPDIEDETKDIMELVANDDKQQEISFAQFE